MSRLMVYSEQDHYEDRIVSKDDMLTVLADCQRILKNPKKAGYLIASVALLRNDVQPATIGEDVPMTWWVKKALRLGISVFFTEDAPKGGELRPHGYEHKFVYPISATKGSRWKQELGRCMHRAIVRMLNDTAEKMGKSRWDIEAELAKKAQERRQMDHA